MRSGGRRTEGSREPVDEPDTDRLARMLVVQHRQRDARDAKQPGSPEWAVADALLDLANARLIYLATAGAMPLEALGDRLEGDVDSRPEDDEAFRVAVIGSVRQAVGERARARLESRVRDRLDASWTSAESTARVLARAGERLRTTYPDASLAGVLRPDGLLDVTARRDRGAA